MHNFFDLSISELEQGLAGMDQRSFRAGQLLRWVYTFGASGFLDMTDIPLSLREALTGVWDLNPLREADRARTEDGTVKFLHVLKDGEMIESVLIPEDGHNTLCISTQSGCRMSCAFCETGRDPGGRDLTSGEILAQIVYAVRFTGERLGIRNLVFMGMGEPLLNIDALLKAVDMILSERGLDFSPRRVTVSTCGWVPGIEKLASVGLDINLAVSLNATDDTTRSRIMPVNRQYPIRDLMEAVRRFPLSARKRITFEYVLMEGVNDSPEDARRLKNLLTGIPAKVNIIPCNDNSSELRAPDEDATAAFRDRLHEYGVLATLRKSRGGEIGAACGQLKASAAGN